jgi:hypothetical protein
MPMRRRSPLPEDWQTKSFASVSQDGRTRIRRRTPELEQTEEIPVKKKRRHPRLDAIRAATEEYRGHPRTKEDKVRAKDAILLIAEARKEGRPPDYNELFCDFAFKMMLLGLTKDELALQLEVPVQTVNDWCDKHSEFSAAIMRGSRFANAQTSHSLYQRANGFEREAVKIFQFEGAPVYAPYMEYYPPDTAAIKMLMVNREPDLWRDRRELTGKDGSPLMSDPKRLTIAELLEAMVLGVVEKDLDDAKTVEGVFEVIE